MRTLEDFIVRIREELRAEGEGGGGYSSRFIIDAINSAQDTLVEMFTLRDEVEFTTTEDVNTYDLTSVITDKVIENIIKISYDDIILKGVMLDTFLNKSAPTEGTVREWVLWGNNLTLLGKVEASKVVKLWITRAPIVLTDVTDTLEIPYYTQEAVIHYALSACYRESRDYDRAGFHYSIYQKEYSMIRDRAVSQGQRDHLPAMRDDYWGVVRGREGITRSDTNPGGRGD